MTNDNCLKGIKCPQCSQSEHMRITAQVVCDVTDYGSESLDDHFWDEDSFTQCPECKFEGKLIDFRVPELPPDPEGMNDKRAKWAGCALLRFRKLTGADECDAVCDLLCDLMHWCDRNGQDFGRALDRARFHYEAETAPTEGE